VLIHLKVFGYMFRPHCGHIQANIYRLSTFNVRTIWDPIVCTIVMCVITTIKTYICIIFYPQICFNSGYYTHYNCTRGPSSVVGIATAYGLDGPGIESQWGRDFPHLSRPALRPTQPPVQWVPGLSRG